MSSKAETCAAPTRAQKRPTRLIADAPVELHTQLQGPRNGLLWAAAMLGCAAFWALVIYAWFAWRG